MGKTPALAGFKSADPVLYCRHRYDAGAGKAAHSMDWSAQSNSGGRHLTHQNLASRMIEQKRAPIASPASAPATTGATAGAAETNATDDDGNGSGDTDTDGGTGGPVIPAPVSVKIQSQNGEIPEQILIGYPDDPYEELYAMNADGDGTHDRRTGFCREDENGNKITKTFCICGHASNAPRLRARGQRRPHAKKTGQQQIRHRKHDS
ncbi:MAG: hypothetical protein R3D66_01920 [Alphaproteobacteria bacterium]